MKMTDPQQQDEEVRVDSSFDAFDVDGEGNVIRLSASGTEDYSGSPLNGLNIVSPESGGGGSQSHDGGAGALEGTVLTPINQGIGGQHFSSNATSLSRETTDLGGHRVKETTMVSTMPNGTTIRTTQTFPIDPENKFALKTTVHERTEPSGQMTRTTLTNHPDGSRVKQVETIRPGGSKSVMIETTDPKGQRSVETAEYPPTLVSPPESYGMGSGQTVVSEITFARTQAPWASPATTNGGYSKHRPIDVDDMKELDYDDDKPRPPPYWTTKRKLLMAGATFLVAGVAAAAAVGIVLAGNEGEPNNLPDGANTDNADDNNGNGGNGNNTSTEEDENSIKNPLEDLINNSTLTPASVGFEHEWRSEEGWVVAPSFSDTGNSYYRPYLRITDLGLCADRCAKTDAVGGAYFPRINGEDSLCYCFVAAECLEPLISFTADGTIFMNEPRPSEACDVSLCWYFPDDPLCEGVQMIFDEPTSSPDMTMNEETSSPTTEATSPPTPSPTVNETIDETASPTANVDVTPPDGNDTTDGPTPSPSRPPTLAPSPGPSPSQTKSQTSPPSPSPTEAPTESQTTQPTATPTTPPTAQPTASPTLRPTPAPTTPGPTSEPTLMPVACTYQPLERDIPCGDFRYTPWAELKPTVQLLAQLKLEYNEETWNNPGTAPIEKLSWDRLNKDQRLGAQSAGFDKESWDCHQNHYRDYSWDDLAAADVQKYYRELGFEELSWSTLGEEDLQAVVGNLPWDSFSAELVELCYSESLWNGNLSL